MDSDAGLVYVANSAGRSITVFGATTGAVVRTVALAGNAFSVAVDARTHLAYLTVNAQPWTIVALDGRPGTVQGHVELPSFTASRESPSIPGRGFMSGTITRVWSP